MELDLGGCKAVREGSNSVDEASASFWPILHTDMV